MHILLLYRQCYTLTYIRVSLIFFFFFAPSCCVDEVAAQHYRADSLIHFGHACLSDNARLPVLYVFTKSSLDINDSALKVQNLFKSNSQKTVLVYDTAYFHVIGITLLSFSKFISCFLFSFLFVLQ